MEKLPENEQQLDLQGVITAGAVAAAAELERTGALFALEHIAIKNRNLQATDEAGCISHCSQFPARAIFKPSMPFSLLINAPSQERMTGLRVLQDSLLSF